MSREDVEAVRLVFEAWNAGELDRFGELVDPEFEFLPLRSQLVGSAYRGPEGVRQFAKDAADEWEHLRIVPDEFFEVGEDVLVIGNFDARGVASGVDVRLPVGWVARVRDGRLTHLRAYSDPDAAREAVGLVQ